MRNSLFQSILFESQQQFTDLFQAEENFNSTSIKNAEKFLNKLKEFKKISDELIDIWHEDDDNVINLELSKKYPFESSFDDYNIVDWVKDVEKNLKFLKSK